MSNIEGILHEAFTSSFDIHYSLFDIPMFCAFVPSWEIINRLLSVEDGFDLFQRNQTGRAKLDVALSVHEKAAWNSIDGAVGSRKAAPVDHDRVVDPCLGNETP